MRNNGAEGDPGAGGKKERELVDVFDQNVGPLRFDGAPDRTAAEQGKAVSASHPANVDAVQSDSLGRTLPAGADQSNPVTLGGQSPEYLEQVDLGAASVRIGSILPIDQEDVHEKERLRGL
jgi:hypothetical protein